GDASRASSLWEASARHFEPLADRGELSRARAGLARLRATNGDLAEAERLADRALADAEEAGDPLVLGRALLVRADVQHRAGDLKGARRNFRRAMTLFEDNGLRRDLAEAYLAYATFAGLASAQLPDAFPQPPAAWLARAQNLFRQVGGLQDLERVREAFRKHG